MCKVFFVAQDFVTCNTPFELDENVYIMISNFVGEQWKTVKFDFEYTNSGRIEVSNLGRLRTFNKASDGNILNGSMVNGYRIIRLKLYKPRIAQKAEQLQLMQQKVLNFEKKVKSLKESLGTTSATDSDYPKLLSDYNDAVKLFTSLKKNLSKKFADDLKERVINYQSLFHRLVAIYFCKRPSEQHVVVAHLDFDKLNNRSNNLVWMTREENFIHQQNSPLVIAEKNIRNKKLRSNSNVATLTVTKVMLLKKMLNQGKPMRTLVKQFKITETQIRRIKKGENWNEIEAAS